MSGVVQFAAGSVPTAAQLNSLIPAPWTTATLLNSWANYGNATTPAQYRLVNPVTVEVIGVVVAGTVTSGTTIFTLPSGYYDPNNSQGLLAFEWVSGTAALTWFQVNINGNVTLEGSATAGTRYAFHAFISVDA